MHTSASSTGSSGGLQVSSSLRPRVVAISGNCVVSVETHDEWFRQEKLRLRRKMADAHPDRWRNTLAEAWKRAMAAGQFQKAGGFGGARTRTIGSGPHSNFQKARRAYQAFMREETSWYRAIGLDLPR